MDSHHLNLLTSKTRPVLLKAQHFLLPEKNPLFIIILDVNVANRGQDIQDMKVKDIKSF